MVIITDAFWEIRPIFGENANTYTAIQHIHNSSSIKEVTIVILLKKLITLYHCDIDGSLWCALLLQ